jgi:hypothetical protein
MAVDQPSRTGGRSEAIESLGVYRSGLAIVVQYVCECKLGFVPSQFLQVDAQDAAPCRASSVGLVPGYRVDAPHAVREAASMLAGPAGAPQRRATAKLVAGQATVSRYACYPPGC